MRTSDEGRDSTMTQSTEKLTAVVTMLSDIEASAVCLAIRAADHVADLEDAFEGMLGHTRGIPAPCASDILARRGYRVLERYGAVESDYDAISYLQLADAIEDIRRDARRKPNGNATE